jgi:glycerol-3-phosphate dehydrogenase
VLALGRDLDLLAPLAPGLRYLEAEVAWAARHEFALSLDDVLARRTRLAFETRERGLTAANRAAEILAAELGWSGSEASVAIDRYARSVNQEYAVPLAVHTPAPISSLAPSEAAR